MMKTVQEIRREYIKEHSICEIEDSNAMAIGRMLERWRNEQAYQIAEVAEIIGATSGIMIDAEKGIVIDSKKCLSYLILAGLIN